LYPAVGREFGYGEGAWWRASVKEKEKVLRVLEAVVAPQRQSFGLSKVARGKGPMALGLIES
jgi:hypothetical protein